MRTVEELIDDEEEDMPTINRVQKLPAKKRKLGTQFSRTQLKKKR